MLERIKAISFGSVTYVLFSWIPLIGALISGFIAGTLSAGGIRRGLEDGFISALLGFVIVIALMNLLQIKISGFIDMLFFSIFIVYHTINIILASLGGAFGGITATHRNKQKKVPSGFYDAPPKVYVICSSCGQSNREKDENCRTCGKNLF